MTIYYRWIIVDGSGAEISRDYVTLKEAEFDFVSYAKLYAGCRIKKKRYQYY